VLLLSETGRNGKDNDNGDEELGIVLLEGTGTVASDVSFSRCCTLPLPLLTLVLLSMRFVSMLFI
jgi:hypothetical protein